MQYFYNLFCLCFWCHNDHSSFTCKVKWLQSKHSADSLHFRCNRNFFSIQTDSNITLSRNLIKYCSNSTSCRITDDMQIMCCIYHFFHSMP